MTGMPPVPPGQVSPDGLWRWDGAQWAPTMMAGSLSPKPRGSQAWIGWLVGGCSLLVVIAFVVAALGASSLMHNIQSSLRNGTFTCLPPDFPIYPRATTVSQGTYFGTSTRSGDSRACHLTYDSNDDVATVADYYSSQLNGGKWTVTSDDRANGLITFHLNSRPQTVGTIQLLGRGQHSEFQIQLDS